MGIIRACDIGGYPPQRLAQSLTETKMNPRPSTMSAEPPSCRFATTERTSDDFAQDARGIVSARAIGLI